MNRWPHDFYNGGNVAFKKATCWEFAQLKGQGHEVNLSYVWQMPDVGVQQPQALQMWWCVSLIQYKTVISFWSQTCQMASWLQCHVDCVSHNHDYVDDGCCGE